MNTPAFGAAPATVAGVESVQIEIDELDNGLVCTMRERPGSRITQKYCYTREERAANTEANAEYARAQLEELQRQQEYLEIQRREAEAARQRAMMERLR